MGLPFSPWMAWSRGRALRQLRSPFSHQPKHCMANAQSQDRPTLLRLLLSFPLWRGMKSGGLVLRGSGCQNQKGPWGHLMQALHFTDKTQRGPVRNQDHTAGEQPHWAKNQVSRSSCRTLFGLTAGHTARQSTRRYFGCGYSMVALGYCSFGTSISLGEAGQVPGWPGSSVLSVWTR